MQHKHQFPNAMEMWQTESFSPRTIFCSWAPAPNRYRRYDSAPKRERVLFFQKTSHCHPSSPCKGHSALIFKLFCKDRKRGVFSIDLCHQGSTTKWAEWQKTPAYLIKPTSTERKSEKQGLMDAAKQQWWLLHSNVDAPLALNMPVFSVFFSYIDVYKCYVGVSLTRLTFGWWFLDPRGSREFLCTRILERVQKTTYWSSWLNLWIHCSNSAWFCSSATATMRPRSDRRNEQEKNTHTHKNSSKASAYIMVDRFIGLLLLRCI